MIFRNANGGLIGAMGQQLNQWLSLGTAELFAIKIGLDFA